MEEVEKEKEEIDEEENDDKECMTQHFWIVCKTCCLHSANPSHFQLKRSELRDVNFRKIRFVDHLSHIRGDHR